jgi:type IV pilus assembly protein PilV
MQSPKSAESASPRPNNFFLLSVMASVRLNCCQFNNKNSGIDYAHFAIGLQYSYGFSLVEVLVSIVILAIGVIGAAGMQLAAARTTQQSGLQTVALQLASEMSDKIRANGLAAGSPDENPFFSVDYNSATQGEPSAPDKLCFAFDCSDRDLAAFDIYEWERRIKNELPGGRARICRDAKPWDQGSRSLTWECTPGSADGVAPLVIKIGWQGKNLDGSLARSSGTEFPPAVAMAVNAYGG